ncbi:hypothetical protein FRC09_012461 [Ceratobasidium sp. 395]|nr:hypothetical protein FRC09_012461 [Ceratobasidium sp. 395]
MELTLPQIVGTLGARWCDDLSECLAAIPNQPNSSYCQSPDGYPVEIPNLIWPQVAYFTVLNDIYCRDLDGSIYWVDEQSCCQTKAIPSPILPYSTFQLGPFSYRFDAEGSLYVLKDSYENPWECKRVYEDAYLARTALGAQVMAGSIEENLDVYRSDYEALMDILRCLSSSSDFPDQDVDACSGTSSSDSGTQAGPSSSPTPSLVSASSSSSLSPDLRTPPCASPVEVVSSPFPDVRMIDSWTQEDIDKWVDSYKAPRRSRDKQKARPDLKCPWPTCKAKNPSRRPQTLKEHLYAHLNIKRALL